MAEKIIELLQGDSEETPDSLITQLESNKEHHENINKVITEVNTMIGKLKSRLNLSKKETTTDDPFPSPLSEENKRKLLGMFRGDSLTNNIQSVKDSAIFGIVLDMIHETITSGEA